MEFLTGTGLTALHRNLYRLLCSCGLAVTGGGRPLDLEEQVLVIAVPPAASQHRPDVAVDRLDLPEGDRLVAVADDAVQVAGEQLAELLEGRQALPAQGLEPVGEKAAGRPPPGVHPEGGEV